MKAKARILYVEDDESLSFVTKDNLQLQGYQITCCYDGKSALKASREEHFDLCVLDVMLPEMDGFAVAREIRRRDQHIPIIFLTAKSLKEDRIHGLKLGADDYLTKPFSIEELILKIEVFLRRSQAPPTTGNSSSYQIGNYELNYANLVLQHGDREHKLTQREADLLRLLARHPNQLLKRAEILESIWGEDDYFLGRSLDVFISRLRKHLKADPNVRIENVHGVGFRLQID